jgi:hypothetical protein
MSKIKKITVSNLKVISEMSADFNGCTAIITGANNSGKTSFIKSLADRIRGKRPNQPVKDGEDNGFAEYELTTGERLRWEFNNSDNLGKLIFWTKDNIKTSLTTELRDRYFPPVFDIDKFLQSSPKEQGKILQKLAGLDFAEIEAEYKMAYEDRTFANRNLKEEKAKEMPINDNLPEDEIDNSELQKEYDTIDLHNERYEKALNEKLNIENLIEEQNNEIIVLKNKIQNIENSIKEKKERLINAEGWLKNKENKPKTNAEEIQNKLIEIHNKNMDIKNNNQAKQQKQIIETAEFEAKKAADRVKEIEKKKQDLIKSAKLPDGFDITEDGILVNGLLLSKEQLSTSQIYISALKLAALELGEVKSLHFEASALDKNNLEEIEKWAKSNNLQLLIERPDYDGGDIKYEIIEK